MLSPFTPHMCEELWAGLGHPEGVVAAGWPAWDEDAAREESIEIPVQVNGKLRGRITVAADASDIASRPRPLRRLRCRHLAGKRIVKVIIARAGW
jgi:leucyl-tRNA synthetase